MLGLKYHMGMKQNGSYTEQINWWNSDAKTHQRTKARVTPMQNMVTNELAEEIFGVNLQNQNRAFYVPLQLFDVLWGIQDAKTKM